jgi:hypothetical protein
VGDITRRRVLQSILAATAYGRGPPDASATQVAGPLHYANLADVARRIAAREILPSDLTQQMLDRIAAVDGRLQSVTITTDRALASARRADTEIEAGRYRGPLHGVPIGVKDLCFTRGVRTMAGTKVFADFVPDFDATVVARLEASGAIILGKLVLCEGAFGPYFPGLQVPVNPWDATRWSGVSSSVRRGDGGRPLFRRGRHGHRGIDPVPVGRERVRRPQAHVWSREPLRRVRARPFHGPCRADGPHRGRRRHPVRSDGGRRSE